MNYDKLKSDNKDVTVEYERSVLDNEKFQIIFKDSFCESVSLIFELTPESDRLFYLRFKNILVNSGNFDKVQNELFIILNVSKRYLMIKELIKNESQINFGLFGILFYLGLTCFDTLGQKHKFKSFDNWLNWKSNRKVVELEMLIRKFSDKNLRKELYILYKDFYLPEYGVKSSFFNFFNLIKENNSYRSLLSCVETSNFVSRQLSELGLNESFKKDWLYNFRNDFTHNTNNRRLPLDDIRFHLYYKVKSKEFDIYVNPNKILECILNCIKIGTEIKLQEIELLDKKEFCF